MDVILWYSLWFRRFEIKQGRQLRAKKMDGQSRQSSPVKDAQRPGRRAASDFPSLLTVRSSAQNARSHFEKRKEVEDESREILRGRAALLKVEDIYQPTANAPKEGRRKASSVSRCSLPETCMHANTQFDKNNLCCMGSPQEAKAERGCSASSCYVS